MTPYYQDEFVTIFHADCREILPQLEPVDLVLTDPPYGIGYASNRTCETTTAEWMNIEINGDVDVSLRDEVLGGFTEWCCFGSIKTPHPPGTRGVAVWDKGPASGMGNLAWPFKLSWELIYFRGDGWSGKRDEGVIKGLWVVTRKSMGRCHPNEKPVSLLCYLLSKQPKAKTVLDPFAGSGTTLRAAKDLGIKSIGIEIEEKYCEIAAKRLQQEVLWSVMEQSA